MLEIHVIWEGPYSHKESLELNSEADYGLYQFYGDHLVYGQDVLLYLGKAETQTLGRRIAQQNWQVWTSSPVQIYVGKIASSSPLENEAWEKQICLAERIILQSHAPSFNSSNLNSTGHSGGDVRVLNWGMRRQLLPEISISRWEGEHAVGNRPHERFRIQIHSTKNA